jgi:ribokinase
VSVVVLGSANIDLVYRVARIPGGGETVLASGSAEHAGGKGNNQAIAARRAGARVGFIAALGDDEYGDRLADLLADASVDALLRRSATPTGTAVITVDDDGENTIVVSQGANGEFVALSDAELSLLRTADYLLLQLEIPIATVVAAAADARANGVTVVLNAAPVRELPAELTDNVDILIVNEHEALSLAARIAPHAVLPRVMTVDDARDIVAILLRIVPAVVVTMGASGSVVLTRDMGDSPAAHVPAPAVPVVDTTGAGDTFCGALVAELDAGADLIEAAQFANIAGGIAVQSEGAVPSIPTRSRIESVRRAADLLP